MPKHMVFNKDGSATLLAWFELETSETSERDSWSGVLAAAREFFRNFFLILPLIELMDPMETREGDVNFGVSAESGAGVDCCTIVSGSATSEEVMDWLSIVNEPFEGEVRFVGTSLPLKTLVISVVCFLMKEPPRFFLVGSSALVRLIELESEREGFDFRASSSLTGPTSTFDSGFEGTSASVGIRTSALSDD
jgi:hypothetical protein